MKLLAIVIREVIHLHARDELENGTLGKIRRLINDDPTVLNARAKGDRHALSVALSSGTTRVAIA